MLFSTPIFLFLFLPVTLAAYYLLKDSYRNFFLLIASLLFYAWGEPVYILLMLLSTVFNYFIGLLIGRYHEQAAGKLSLGIGIVVNIMFLMYYKYFNFFIDSFNYVTGLHLPSDPISLPLGISFYTFHSLSYIIDIYRRVVAPQKNILDLGLYISFFPQLVAGPIIRYKDINQEIEKREPSLDNFSSGVIRFITGFSKKVLIANTFGAIADRIFNGSFEGISGSIAWTGIIAYTLQIYFDFSGYSDMAIGLGRMFGFHIHENFNLPYIARSIRDFWRRWHISLSTWFRDYLYIPLGGSKGSTWKVYRNLLIVFFVTGFWHGASMSFIFWGLFHGFFIVLERGWWGRTLDKSIRPVQHLYTLLVVMIGWVFFRVEELTQAVNYVEIMFGKHWSYDLTTVSYLDYWDTKAVVCLVLGVFFATDIPLKIQEVMDRNESVKLYFRFGLTCLWLLAFMISLAAIAAQTYNPFIYFRF